MTLRRDGRIGCQRPLDSPREAPSVVMGCAGFGCAGRTVAAAVAQPCGSSDRLRCARATIASLPNAELDELHDLDQRVAFGEPVGGLPDGSRGLNLLGEVGGDRRRRGSGLLDVGSGLDQFACRRAAKGRGARQGRAMRVTTAPPMVAAPAAVRISREKPPAAISVRSPARTAPRSWPAPPVRHPRPDRHGTMRATQARKRTSPSGDLEADGDSTG
jgi:hypothetical protein